MNFLSLQQFLEFLFTTRPFIPEATLATDTDKWA
jgi:hypothetical protein